MRYLCARCAISYELSTIRHRPAGAGLLRKSSRAGRRTGQLFRATGVAWQLAEALVSVNTSPYTGLMLPSAWAWRSVLLLLLL
jgi:hypothetical protein